MRRSSPPATPRSGAAGMRCNHLHQRAADDRRVGVAAGLGDLLGREMPKPRPPAATTCARTLASSGSTSPAQRVARAGDAQPRDHVEKPAAELRRPPDPLIRRRRADQEYRIEAGVDQGRCAAARPPRPGSRAAARRPRRPSCASRANTVGVHPHHRIRIGEEHDRRVERLRGTARIRASEPAQRHAGGERAFAGALDHRAVGERIGERHAHFDDVGAAAGQRGEDRRPSVRDRDRRR